MESNHQYLKRRTVEEEAAADRSSDPKVREVHVTFAARYRDAAKGDGAPKRPGEEARAIPLPREFRILE